MIEFQKKPKMPSAWDIIQNKGKVEIEKDNRVLPVKTRLENMSREEPKRLISVKERLERLQDEQKVVFRPIDRSILPDAKPQQAMPILTPESNMQKKIEKVFSKLSTLKSKMKDPSNYLSHYYDLQKCKQELVELVEESKRDRVKLPESFQQKIDRELESLKSVKT